jgi:hypothetical protein
VLDARFKPPACIVGALLDAGFHVRVAGADNASAISERIGVPQSSATQTCVRGTLCI